MPTVSSRTQRETRKPKLLEIKVVTKKAVSPVKKVRKAKFSSKSKKVVKTDQMKQTTKSKNFKVNVVATYPVPQTEKVIKKPILEKQVSIKIKKVHFHSRLKVRRFRVAIFGSARIEKSFKDYKSVYKLARALGKKGYDVITGGGPGLMAAANEGHSAGDKDMKAESIGLVIKLPWENKPNSGVELQQDFNKFSTRLETFLDLLSVAVITTGGLGTVLELAYMWQYTQVKKVRPFPIILVGNNWKKLMTWFKKYLLAQGLMSREEFSNIFVAKDVKEAMKIINKAYGVYKKTPESIKPILQSKLYQR